MTARFSDLLPRALDELEERWRARHYTALQVREFCAKLVSRMRSTDEAHRPRIDALYAATDRDPAVIASAIDEIIESHEQGDNYRDTLEESYNLLDRAAAVPKQHELLKRFVAKVVTEARGHAAKDATIAEYLGAWLAPKTWRTAGVAIPGDAGAKSAPTTTKNAAATRIAATKPAKPAARPVAAPAKSPVATKPVKPAAKQPAGQVKSASKPPIAKKPAVTRKR